MLLRKKNLMEYYRTPQRGNPFYRPPADRLANKGYRTAWLYRVLIDLNGAYFYFYGDPYKVWLTIPGATNLSRENPVRHPVYGQTKHRLCFRWQYNEALIIEMLKTLPALEPAKTDIKLAKYKKAQTLAYRMRAGYNGAPASGSLKNARTTRIVSFDKLPKAFVKPAASFRPTYLFNNQYTDSINGMRWEGGTLKFVHSKKEYEHLLIRLTAVQNFGNTPTQLRVEQWVYGGEVYEWTLIYASVLNYLNCAKVAAIGRWPEHFSKETFDNLKVPKPTSSLHVEICDLGAYLIFARLGTPYSHWATVVEKYLTMDSCQTTFALGDPQYARDMQEWVYDKGDSNAQKKKDKETPSLKELGVMDRRFIKEQFALRSSLRLMEEI